MKDQLSHFHSIETNRNRNGALNRPNKLYNEDYCVKALEVAKHVFKLAEKLLNEIKK